MTAFNEALFVCLILTNIGLFVSSRWVACIRLTALQGVLLGMLTVLIHTGDLTARTFVLAVGSIAVKAGVFPWLIARSIREANVRRELDPIVGYTGSLVIGAGLLGVSLWLSSRLPAPMSQVDTLAVPAAFFSILAGLFLITSRKTAVAQVLGYLVMENGIYTFGIALANEQPLLVELGVLLDLFVAVFVMGITIFHIQREFDHIDTGRLSSLKDSNP